MMLATSDNVLQWCTGAGGFAVNCDDGKLHHGSLLENWIVLSGRGGSCKVVSKVVQVQQGLDHGDGKNGIWDQLVDWYGDSSNAGLVPERWGEVGAEREGEAFNLPVTSTFPTLTFENSGWWLKERGHSYNQPKLVSSIGQLDCWALISIRILDWTWLLHCLERASWGSSGLWLGCLVGTILQRFPGTSNWEKTSLFNQNTLRRLHISSSMETPQDFPGGSGKCCERCLEYSA